MKHKTPEDRQTLATMIALELLEMDQVQRAKQMHKLKEIDSIMWALVRAEMKKLKDIA